jgi:hypothetical protein
VAQFVESLCHKSEGVSGILHGRLSGRSVPSNRVISWEVKAADGQVWPSYHRHMAIFWKSGSFKPLESSGSVQVRIGIGLPS